MKSFLIIFLVIINTIMLIYIINNNNNINRLKKEIIYINTQFPSLVTKYEAKQRALYVDYNIKRLSMNTINTHILAMSSYDKNNNKYDWTIGLTTHQIDSILSYCKPEEYYYIATELREKEIIK